MALAKLNIKSGPTPEPPETKVFLGGVDITDSLVSLEFKMKVGEINRAEVTLGVVVEEIELDAAIKLPNFDRAKRLIAQIEQSIQGDAP